MSFAAFVPFVPGAHALRSRTVSLRATDVRRRRRAVVRSCEDGGPRSLPVGRSESAEAQTVGFVGAPKLGVSFTCTADDCGTRVSKMIRRSSYEKGTVLIQCPTCKVRHIISDNFGWYSDVSGNLNNIEKIAKSKGENVVRVSTDVFGLEKLVSTFLGVVRARAGCLLTYR